MIDRYFATVARGLEEIAAAELTELGAVGVRPDFTGVHFQGDRRLLYAVNLWARTIFRVLKPIREIKSYNPQQLYHNASKIEWEEYLTSEQTFAVKCTGSNPHLNHSHFSALQIKNAIVDRQRQRGGKRSRIDVKNPDISINAHIQKNRCSISLDSSGESLHRRGYRPAVGVAPLKETLAAALLEMAQWNQEMAFFDPMCGSGTLPLEATLKALNIAPGLYRHQFGFQHWLDFDAALWAELVAEAKNERRFQLQSPICGSDRAAEIIAQAEANAIACGVREQVQFKQQELSAVEPPAARGILICNPPYGKRISTTEELYPLYRQLGDILKQRFRGWTAYILSGNRELSKCIGLRASRRIPVLNGSLSCTLLKYELY